MANATTARVSVLSFLIIFSLLYMGTQARSLNDHCHRGAPRKIDSKRLLHELGFDLSKLENSATRLLTDRVTPGGPDSQHHKLEPATPLP